MISWPHCFGPVLAQHGRSMWKSKTTYIMSQGAKIKREEAWIPQFILRAHFNDLKTFH
jgi:hypothetical protein